MFFDGYCIVKQIITNTEIYTKKPRCCLFSTVESLSEKSVHLNHVKADGTIVG